MACIPLLKSEKNSECKGNFWKCLPKKPFWGGCFHLCRCHLQPCVTKRLPQHMTIWAGKPAKETQPEKSHSSSPGSCSGFIQDFAVNHRWCGLTSLDQAPDSLMKNRNKLMWDHLYKHGINTFNITLAETTFQSSGDGREESAKCYILGKLEVFRWDNIEN